MALELRDVKPAHAVNQLPSKSLKPAAAPTTLNALRNAVQSVGSKVAVDCDRGGQFQALHEGKRCAVREAETLISILAEDAPGVFLVFARQIVQRSDITVYQSLAKRLSRFPAEAVAKKRKGLIQDIVA